jgi:DNA-binding NarL/FixJ family response regulator
MCVIRILVVDDFEPWRRFVASALQKHSHLQIVFEASDGLQAVRKAEELQPDLILLDIGLPTLNGIEAARRIRSLAPNAKILFLSENDSSDIAEAALNTGAKGYVIKSDAGRELLTAIWAVLGGKQFVSARFAKQISSGTHDEPISSEQTEKSVRHEVQFYRDDEALLDGFARFVSGALEAGGAVIVVVTESHRQALHKRLQTSGLNMEAAIKEGIYIPLDVQAMLSKIMVNGLPDPDRFWKAAASLVEAATKAAKGKHPSVAACGECAPRLWLEGKADAAVQLESLWDEAARAYGLSILCGYPLESFRNGEGRDVQSRISAIHSTIMPRAAADQIL